MRFPVALYLLSLIDSQSLQNLTTLTGSLPSWCPGITPARNKFFIYPTGNIKIQSLMD